MRKALPVLLLILFPLSYLSASPEEIARIYAEKALAGKDNPKVLKSNVKKVIQKLRAIGVADTRNAAAARIADRFFRINLLAQGTLIGQEVMDAIERVNVLTRGALRCAPNLEYEELIKGIEACKSLPVRYRVLQSVALYYAGKGDFEHAVSTAGNISKTYVLYPDTMSRIAVMIVKNGNLDKGLAFAKKLPRNSVSQNMAYAEIAKYAAEYVSYEKCFSLVALIPGGSNFNEQVYIFVIELQIQRDELGKARMTLDRFRKRSLTWRRGVVGLSEAYLSKGNPDRALEISALLPKGAMEYCKLMEQIAIAYFNRGDEDAALKAVDGIVVSTIRDKLYQDFAQQLQRKGDKKKAWETVNKINRQKAKEELKEVFRMENQEASRPGSETPNLNTR